MKNERRCRCGARFLCFDNFTMGGDHPPIQRPPGLAGGKQDQSTVMPVSSFHAFRMAFWLVTP